MLLRTDIFIFQFDSVRTPYINLQENAMWRHFHRNTLGRVGPTAIVKEVKPGIPYELLLHSFDGRSFKDLLTFSGFKSYSKFKIPRISAKLHTRCWSRELSWSEARFTRAKLEKRRKVHLFSIQCTRRRNLLANWSGDSVYTCPANWAKGSWIFMDGCHG